MVKDKELPYKTHQKKTSTVYKLLLLAALLLILVVLLAATNFLANQQNIRSKATDHGGPPSAQRIILLEFEFEKDDNDDIRMEFDKPEIRNGFVTGNLMISGNALNATLLDTNQNPILSQKFSLPEVVSIDGIDATTGREHGEMREVKADEYALTLPYDQNGEYVKIEDNKNDILALLSIKNAHSIHNIVAPTPKHGDDDDDHGLNINSPFMIDKTYAANGTFNIAIIGDNYQGDSVRFQSDVNDLVRGLVSIEPFATNRANIIFYPQLSAVSLCLPKNGWPAINCNDGLVLQEASTLPHDKIYVLYNGNYTGYAYIRGMISYGTNSLDQNLAVKQGLFIHEMVGHSLGGLMDEYSYNTSGLSYAPNCTPYSSCPDWSTVAGLGCFNTCGYTNLYRATDNSSVMNSSFFRGLLYFDSFSTQIVQTKLAELLNTSSATPTFPPTIAPTPTSLPTLIPTSTSTPTPVATLTPTLTPTITPTLDPSITVTVTPLVSQTPTPTLTSTPTPTLTVTPTSTITPTPSVVLCSIPNYCTLEKYCDLDLRSVGDCNSIGKVCCSPQTVFPTESPLLNPQGIVITPTIAQRFEEIPTLPPNQPEISVTPTHSPTLTVPLPSPTNNIFPTPTVYITPTITITPSPLIISPTHSSRPTSISTISPSSPAVKPTVTEYPRLSHFIFDTPTPFNVENLEFKRASPTPVPPFELPNIIQPSKSFISTIIEKLLSLLFNRN